ncbi:lipase family protein [Anaerospora hongkongensis]|uniref:lipase family protein n=1 Tax=Anaerospora hongkongensis TaxID=244830 RepID=UPI0028A29EE2|nr:lipase family protein [Anaerospora hongkongensis]
MKNIRRWIVILLLIVCSINAGTVAAQAASEDDEAYTIYLAASACVAAYSDRPGALAKQYLTQQGWQIQPYEQSNKNADARFLVIKNMNPSSLEESFLIAFTGTETVKDIKTDILANRVYFAGQTVEEFAANAAKKKIAASEPKIHRGFHEYVQAALTTKVITTSTQPQLLSEWLLADTSHKVYLTGHSLGGAVATVTAARLISMGVKPGQIEVITFGAPAVGNDAFNRQFEPVIDLTRVVISGDVVTGLLQSVAGGYAQFGREICWESPDWTNKGPHGVTEYLDLAMKNYYDKRHLARKESANQPQRGIPAFLPKAYIAPVKYFLPEKFGKEQWYMEQALLDEYERILPGCLPEVEPEEAQLQAQAAASGARWLIFPEVSAYQVPNAQGLYYLTLSERMIDLSTGELARLAAFSASTNNLTPLEALLHSARSMSDDRTAWFVKQQESGEQP